MKKTTSLPAFFLWLCFLCVVRAEGAPKLQFGETVYDFGKVSQVTTVSGVFKFKNTGDAILKLEAPKPSCGCTVAELSSNTLAPGASGELPFTLNLGFARATMEKHISVKSNDPVAPDVSLTIKADYTPLYELNPMTLSPSVAFGSNEVIQFTTLTRTDGKPLGLDRLVVSQPWITATVEPSAKPDQATARIRLAIHRDGPARRFNEYVQVYTVGQSNMPVSNIYLYGQIMGEVSLTPEALYWSITDGPKTATPGPEAVIMRKVTIRSATGQPLELKNPQSTIKGIKLELVPQEAGKVYELVARLDDVPATTVSGTVSFETSVAAQPKISVPVIVNVFKP
jgi:hypothetical protein